MVIMASLKAPRRSLFVHPDPRRLAAKKTTTILVDEVDINRLKGSRQFVDATEEPYIGIFLGDPAAEVAVCAFYLPDGEEDVKRVLELYRIGLEPGQVMAFMAISSNSHKESKRFD